MPHPRNARRKFQTDNFIIWDSTSNSELDPNKKVSKYIKERRFERQRPIPHVYQLKVTWTKIKSQKKGTQENTK